MSAYNGSTTASTSASASASVLPNRPRKPQHKLLHTRLVLDLSSSSPHSSPSAGPEPIRCSAQLVYLPLTDKLKYLTFCNRGYHILDIVVDGHPASWSTVNSSLFLSLDTSLRDVRDLRCLQYCFDDEADAYAAGNVCVKLPKRVKEAMKEREKAKRQQALDIDITGNASSGETDIEPIVMTVVYTLDHDCKALTWLKGGNGGEVLTNTALCDASTWHPCFDSLTERSTYDVEVLVDADMQVVAAAQLVSKRYEDDSRTKARYCFACSIPIHSRAMGIAVGRWLVDVEVEHDYVTYFYPLSHHAAFVYTVAAPSTVATVLSMCGEVLGGGWPFSQLHVLFAAVEEPQVLAGMLVMPLHTLTDGRLIDPVYVNRRWFAYQLASCWLSAVVIEKPEDGWLLQGMAGALMVGWVERQFGRNEADYLTLQLSTSVLTADADPVLLSPSTRLLALPDSQPPPRAGDRTERAHEAQPLHWTGYTHPCELYSRTTRDKATVVMLMLQHRVGKAVFAQLMRRVVELHVEKSGEAVRQPSTDRRTGEDEDEEDELDESNLDDEKEAAENKPQADSVVLPLSTDGFLSLAKELSADVDLPSFFTQWVYDTSYPLLSLYYRYNTKKKNTMVDVEQRQCRLYHSGVRVSSAVKFVIHESERVTEQERRIASEVHEFEFSCVSRVRRNRKRKQYDKEQLMSLSLDKLLTRHNDTPVLWVRCDGLLTVFQPCESVANEVMLCLQATCEREVRGQIEALCALWRLFIGRDEVPSSDRETSGRMDEIRIESVEQEGLKLSEQALRDVFSGPDVYVWVRLLAARVLLLSSARDASESSNRDWIERWMRSEWTSKRTSEWKTNSFGDIGLYRLKQRLPIELSRCYDVKSGLSPPAVVRTIVSMLDGNDNEGNAYADDYYIAALLRAVGNLRLAETENRQPLLSLIDRHVKHDQLLPSHRHVITVAALEAAICFQLHHRLHEPIVDYFSFLASHHTAPVRIAAFRCVVLLAGSGRQQRCLPYLMAVLQEPNSYVQVRQLRVWCQLLAGGHVQPPHSAQLCDALWSALLGTSSAAFGSDARSRLWLMRLYRLLFAKDSGRVTTEQQRELNKAVYAALQKAVAERLTDAESEWKSTTARRQAAAEEVKAARVGRESEGRRGYGVMNEDGGGGERTTGRFKIRTKDMRVSRGPGDDDDEDWNGRD